MKIPGLKGIALVNLCFGSYSEFIIITELTRFSIYDLYCSNFYYKNITKMLIIKLKNPNFCNVNC